MAQLRSCAITPWLVGGITCTGAGTTLCVVLWRLIVCLVRSSSQLVRFETVAPGTSRTCVASSVERVAR